MSNSSAHENLSTHKQYFYNIADRYCTDNSIPIVIKNEKVELLENISETKIILVTELMDTFTSLYGKNIAYFNDAKFELKYINKRLAIHEIGLTEKYDMMTDDEWRKAFKVYHEMHDFIVTIYKNFYEQCRIKGLKYPVYIFESNNTALLLEYIKNNEYITINDNYMDDDNCIIISTSNEDTKISNLIEYIFIYIDRVKENIINDDHEFFDNAMLLIHLNHINKVLIENSEDHSHLAEYNRKVNENKIFMDTFLYRR